MAIVDDFKDIKSRVRGDDWYQPKPKECPKCHDRGGWHIPAAGFSSAWIKCDCSNGKDFDNSI